MLTILNEAPYHLNDVSYLNARDSDLFLLTSSVEHFFGGSHRDIIEVGIYDNDLTLVDFSIITGSSINDSTSYIYEDVYGNVFEDTYVKPKSNLVSDPDRNILISIEDIVDNRSITSVNFNLSLSPVSKLFSVENPLIIQQISNSRREVKLLRTFPTMSLNVLSYDTSSINIHTKTLLTDHNSIDVIKWNSEFLSMDLDSFINRTIYDRLEYFLNTFNITDLFDSSKLEFQSEIKSLKSLFVLTDNDDVLNFIRSVFYGDSIYDDKIQREVKFKGIVEYILNYLKFNFDFVNNFTTFYRIVDQINLAVCECRLSYYNSYAQLNPNTQQYIESLMYVSTITDRFLKSTIRTIESEFKNKFKFPLKNSLTIENGSSFLIINSRLEDGVLYLKLKDELPSSVAVGNYCDIKNVSVAPFFQLVNFETPVHRNVIRISGPNFSTDTDDLMLNTRQTKFQNLQDMDVGRELKNKISVSKKVTELSVDYTDFSNFVIFSSANLRLKIFQNKIIQIKTLIDINTTLTAIDPTNSIVDDKLNVYAKLSNNNKMVDCIISSFDGFESFLYKTGKFIYNPNCKKFVETQLSTDVSSYVNELEIDSITYDKNNRDSLINNSPEYITDNVENDDYLKFLSMVGHHFDNIYLYVSNIGICKPIGDSSSDGITGRLVNHMLNSFGFSVPPSLIGSLENSELIETYLSVVDTPTVRNTTSINDTVKIIWKRLLTNLPSIYKSKGTTECLRQIFSAYGIPNNLITVKEFGGGYIENQISSSYVIEEKEYLLEFIGVADEFVKIENIPTFKSLDFKFNIESETYASKNIIIPLCNAVSNETDELYSLGVIKTGHDYGRFYFMIENDTDEFSFVSGQFPIFGDEILNVLLRKNETNENFATTISSSLIPTRYDICVYRNSDRSERMDHVFSFILSGSLNDTFDRSDRSLYFGNFVSSDNIITELATELYSLYLMETENTNSEISAETDVDLFVSSILPTYSVSTFIGCMDGFTVQSTTLTDDDFYLKSRNYNCYSQGSPNSEYIDILFRFSVGIPTDIVYSSSLSDGFIVENANPAYPQSYASLYNFTGRNIVNVIDTSNCVTQSVSKFPHQTREFDVTNEYFTHGVGPNRYENIRIKNIEVSTLSTLSPINSVVTKNKSDIYMDSNKLGIFLSPTLERDKDILDFMGSYDILSTISDPRDRYTKQYVELAKLRRAYYGDNYVPRILFNELFKIYKLYVDKSIFETLRNVLPARSKVYSGILIEPTILERNRVENILISTGNSYLISSSVDTGYELSGDISTTLSGLVTVSSNIDYKSDVNNSFCGFTSILDTPDDYSDNIYISDGGFTEYSGDIYRAYKVSNRKNITYLQDSQPAIEVNTECQSIQLILSGSTFSPPSNYTLVTDVLDVDQFKHIGKKHQSFRKSLYFDTGSVSSPMGLVFSGRSRQTNLTTINEAGQVNREPIIRITVNSTLKNKSNIVGV